MSAEHVVLEWVDWQQCSAASKGTPGCVGRQLDPDQPCFAHSNKDGRVARLNALRNGGSLDFVQGVEFTKELFAELLEATPTEDGTRVLHNADFRAASFQDDVRFFPISFQNVARFDGASFQGDAEFEAAIFPSIASFEGATFQGDAQFTNADFRGEAWFEGVTFQGDARFTEASFQDSPQFDNVSSWGDVLFDQVSFAEPLDLGPIVVMGALVLDRTVFTEPVQLLAAAKAISCRGARFRGGGHLRVAWAEVTLKDAEVSAPLIVSQAPPAPKQLRDLLPALTLFDEPGDSDESGELNDLDDSDESSELNDDRPPSEPLPPPRPSLTSVRRANVEKLTITGLDLRPCRFAGAHHLDQLSLNTTDALHRAPARVGHGRMVLAEECAWRRRQRRNAQRWPDVGLDRKEGPDPAELANLYRQLRKGREDAKNEPGAADFYYGECEMRRHTDGTPLAERAILTAYWLVSGYGLRSTRALLTLLGVALVTVGLLMLYGLPQDPAAQAGGTLQGQVAGGQTITVQLTPPGSPEAPTTEITDRWSWQRFEKATRIAANAVVFRTSEQQLTTPGRYIEMTARFVGPVLLALTLLAVRNRVKR